MAGTKLTYSYYYNASSEPLVYRTLVDDLIEAAEKFPDREAFVFRNPDQPREVMTYKEVNERSNHVAAHLHRLGVQRGGRVAIFSPNEFNWILAAYGALKCGAMTVHVSMASNVEERLQFVLNKTQSSVLILHPGADLSWYQMLERMVPGLKERDPSVPLELHSVPTLKHIISFGAQLPGILHFDDLLTGDQSKYAALVQEINAGVSPDQGAMVFFTSGSTGFPKACAHSHFSMMNKWGAGALRHLGIVDDHDQHVILFNDRPFTHVGGGLTQTVPLRGTRVVIDTTLAVKKSHVDYILQILEEEKCTHGVFCPFLLQDFINHPDIRRYNLSHVKCGIVGGQIVAPELMKKALEIIPSMSNVFGSTEVLGLQGALHDPIEKRLHKIGRPLPLTEVKIIDDIGMVVPINTVGEICARAPDLMQCYLGDPEKTQEAIDEAGWYHFGDLAVMDEDGYAVIVGRKSDIIKRATTKIYPKEVEDALLQHPATEKVQVVGVPDQRFLEEICACIKMRKNSSHSLKDVEEWCRARFVPEKTLDSLGLMPGYFLEFDLFPVTPTGKFDRREIASIAKQRLNL